MLLSEEEIKLIVDSTRIMRTEYATNSKDFNRKEFSKYFNGSTVVDIGSGGGLYLRDIFEAGAKKVVVIEPKPTENLKENLTNLENNGLDVVFNETDALRGLRLQESESSIVTAYGVFSRELIGRKSVSLKKLKPMIKNYYKECAKEIERVVPTGQLAIIRSSSANQIKINSNYLKPIPEEWDRRHGGILQRI